MRFGSVCSGIEAASVAWNGLGWKAAWFSEIEPFPSAVLAHHYPECANLGDMTALPDRITTEEVEAPDLFCGGTPCQAFSVAGLRKSLADARGNLSLTFCEIADAIDSVRSVRGQPATIVFWENVPGVLSTADNAFGCFLAQLCGGDEPLVAANGWPDAGVVTGAKRTVAWRVLDAQYFGVAQRRRRVFVVASARDDFDPAAVLFEFDGLRRDTAPSREAGERTSASVENGISSGSEPSLMNTLCATDHAKWGSNQWVSEGKAVLQPTLTVQTLRTRRPGEGGMSADHEHLVPIVSPALNTQSGSHHAPDTKAYVVTKPIAFGAQMSVPQVDVDLMQTLQAKNPMAVAIAWDEELNASVEQAGTLLRGGQGGRHDGVMKTVAFQVDPQSAEFTDVAPTLDCRAQNGPIQNQLGAGVMQAMQVRRLTPVECERLQGFPDGYTAIPWRGKPVDECPDGPRYKALGNSWAVPVVAWIGKRIQQSINKPE